MRGLIFMKVLWFGYMKEVVCDIDDLILNPLFKLLLARMSVG